MNCTFCSVRAFNGARYRQRPIPDVVREFQLIREKRVLVVDDNLIGTRPDHITRAKDLFPTMARANLQKEWVAGASFVRLAGAVTNRDLLLLFPIPPIAFGSDRLLDAFPNLLARAAHSLPELFAGCQGLALLHLVTNFLASLSDLLAGALEAAAYRFRSHSQFARRLRIQTPGDGQLLRFLVLTDASSCLRLRRSVKRSTNTSCPRRRTCRNTALRRGSPPGKIRSSGAMSSL